MLIPGTRYPVHVQRRASTGRLCPGHSRHLRLAEKTVESHIATLLAKLNLEPAADDNRRVLAVLAWLRAGTNF